MLVISRCWCEGLDQVDYDQFFMSSIKHHVFFQRQKKPSWEIEIQQTLMTVRIDNKYIYLVPSNLQISGSALSRLIF